MLPLGLSSRLPTKEALRAVRTVIAKQTKPVRIQELYKQVIQQPGEKADVPHHGVRSMRYLKHVLLPALVNEQVVEQIHVKPTIKADERIQTLSKMTKSQRQSTTVKTALHGYFAWQAKARQLTPKAKPTREPFGVAVGVGEDWGHLNRRRRRARDENVKRDVEWLKEVEAARRQAGTA